MHYRFQILSCPAFKITCHGSRGNFRAWYFMVTASSLYVILHGMKIIKNLLLLPAYHWV